MMMLNFDDGDNDDIRQNILELIGKRIKEIYINPCEGLVFILDDDTQFSFNENGLFDKYGNYFTIRGLVYKP